MDGIGKLVTLLLLASPIALTVGQLLDCDTSNGWFYLGGSKCYKVFAGNNRRAYTRAKDICVSYGSRLATIKDQFESDSLGSKVSQLVPESERPFYIGLKRELRDTCVGCKELRWSDGSAASELQGFWGDNQPNEDLGDCVHVYKNEETYVYDRPYTFSYGNCDMQRSFVCERMAAPTGSFHCFQGGYVRQNQVCDGNSDCNDASDELNCPSRCHFYHKELTGANGTLASFVYRNAQTCTWAIETAVGTNAFVELRDFTSEESADIATIYVGSLDPTRATVVGQLSGTVGTRQFRSFNNLMIIVFSTDSEITLSGFSGIYGSLSSSSGLVEYLTADQTQRTFTVSKFTIATITGFMGQRDYVLVIKTQEQFQLGQVITVEVDAFQLNDGDYIMFFDGDSAADKVLGKLCNTCDNYFTVQSTKNTMSILLRTGRDIASNSNFRIKYQQGCIFRSSAEFGKLYTPGFDGRINYPNFVKCDWHIDLPTNKSISLYFSSETQLNDADKNRVNNGDFLEIYDNGMALHPVPGFNTAALREKSHVASSGKVHLRLISSPTRSARGFYATWSIGCPDPQFDANTVVDPSPIRLHYTANMTLTCATGYAFHLRQLANGPPSVNLRCGYGGQWEGFLQTPRCTPKYCGVVPNIENGYIESSTGATYGSTATYKCFSGSTLQGVGTISCQADGTWSQRPTCVAASCPSNVNDLSIANGVGVLTIGDGTRIGSYYNYKCNAGYQLVGSPVVICQENGTWSHPEPTCTRLKCLLPQITQGSYIGAVAESLLDFENTLTVTCNSGYQLGANSINTVSCQANRTLTQLPQCVDIDECTSGSPCTKGNCLNSVGSFSCFCNPGYELDASLRNCIDINQCLRNNANCGGTCTNTDGGYICSCSDPFVLYAASGTSGLFIPSPESGTRPSDVYYINHTCVLKSCPAPETNVSRATLLTRRSTHLYGDLVEYQCDMGFTPGRTFRKCGDSGWSDLTPSCTAIQCTDDRPNTGLSNPAVVSGNYNFNSRLDLNCSQAGGAIKFQRYRFCTYNMAMDKYELQGSPYDCGEVDCGIPMAYSGTNYAASVVNTKFGSQFTFTCSAGNTRFGSSEAGDDVVRCTKDGYWDFGSLFCFGQSCIDPGVPLWGQIVATQRSFADQSTVTYQCLRPGYNITAGPTTITCQGSSWNNAQTPECTDTEKPVIANCPSSGIVLNRYERLAGYLPILSVTDNTMVRDLTVSPRNARTTYYVEAPLTVIFTATDHAGNSASCSIPVTLRDETPPSITCPNVQIIELRIPGENRTNPLSQSLFTITDNVDPAPVLSYKTSLPTIFTENDLYKTFTYEVEARDTSNNYATCQGQIYVRPATCSELSFQTPLFSTKSCTFDSGTNTRTCTITCNDGYLTYTSTTGISVVKRKTRTFTCNSGTWSPALITSCVQDTRPPVLTCPQSQVFPLGSSETKFLNFTDGTFAGTVLDANNILSTVYTPASLSLSADTYVARPIVMTVTDAAQRSSTCTFQVNVQPPECHPDSYPSPLNGIKTCTATGFGYSCTITCSNGYLIKGSGTTKTVTCFTGVSWAETDVVTDCVRDQTPPDLQCPTSQVVQISNINDVVQIDFAANALYAPIRNVDSGVPVGSSPTLQYSPSLLTLSQTNVNSNNVFTITLRSTDRGGNAAQCDFYVTVEAPICSYFSLPEISNGQKTCTARTGLNTGFDCTLTCNNGYTFPITTNNARINSITTSCNTGSPFTGTPVMNCVSATQNTVSPVFTGYMEYEYQTTDGTTNIQSTCDQLYVDTFKARSSDFSSQSSQFTVVCKATLEIPGDTLFTFQFLPNETTGRLITGVGTNTNKVRMRYYYTMLSTNATYFRQCEDVIRNLIIAGNYKLEGFTTLETTLNTGVICPPVAYLANSATLTPGIYTCSQNYFRTESACVPCPSGSVRPVANSDTKCEQCQVGYYRDINMGICTACPTGMTTRYLGTTSSSQCIAACISGSVSTTGYQPCYPCAKGSYSISTTTCTPCPTGNSTTSVGASSIAECSVSSYTALERCPLGTQQNYTVGDCIKCDYGTYGVLGIVNGVQEYVCTSCGSNRGTFIRGAVRIEQCYDVCQAGYVSRFAHGLAPCDACAVGFYYNTATRRCDSCPAGTSTLASASIGASACIQTTQIRDNCPLGSFRNQTIGSCEACPLGTYSTGEELNACTQCPSDTSTYMPGATSSAMCTRKCAPGFFSSNGLSPCTPCGLGQFSTAFGATSCSSCSADETTLSTTALSCVRMCAAGRFSFSGNEGVTGSSCRACPQNYYQSSIGQTNCVQCPSETNSQSNGLINVNQCLAVDCTSRCVNGETCIKQDNSFICQCIQGYEGDTCQIVTDVCASSPCYNGGICARSIGSTLGYTCTCNARATGSRCETLIKTCNTSAAAPTCLNGGYCINRWQEPGYECMCPSGFSGARCNQTANICVTNPCSSAGTIQCMDSSNGQNLRRRCMCRPGYGGESCAADINECLSNPCINGGTCVDQVNGFQCVCKSSYTGVFCEAYINPCQSTTCSGQGTCVDVYRYSKHFCSCNAGYTGGLYVEYSLERDNAPDINSYSSRLVTVTDVHACRSQCTSKSSNCNRFTYQASGNQCYIWLPSDMPTFGTQVGYNTFTKHESQQTDDFWTRRYNVLAPSTSPLAESERLNDLTNLGLHICHGSAPIDVRCCPVGQDCTGKALVPAKCADVDRSNLVDGGNPGARTVNDPTNYDVQFKCSLNRVFLSNTCTQKNDYCKPDPCVRGQCQLTFAGYSCSCPSGYTGKNCQTDINECATNPCSNGGTCTDKVNGYLCACKPEYTGATCASQVNYCVGVSCSGNGTCMNRDQGPGYMCNCFQGYTGTNCESQINFCASQPCLHGSSCIPALNTYKCECLPGWTGRNCDTMINYCTGSLCQGTCHPVFTTYYCACGANTYGANCQNRPTPCQTFNKCQNLGTCSYNTTSAIMACTCPAKYNGDGCEWLRDLCNTDNPCKNNADCSIIQDNYKCTCKPGYTGTNCETEINECSGRTCPGGGQCFDAINAYYCRCPLKKTGNNCGREFDRNYDFYFNHPTGMGFAWIPYFIFVPNVDAMSVTGWVRYAAANGKGVYFNMFIGDRLETAKKFLEFNELGVKIHLPNGTIIQHELSRTVQVNDGNWHYITLNFNMVSKAMRLYLDTVYHQPEQTVDISSLKVNNNGFRMWVVLGCEFDNEDHICNGGADSFRGYVSQINIYKRELTFASSSGVAGEISYNFAVPRNIFEDNAQLTNVILVWNEYKFDSGVSRIIPSEAKGDRCSVPNRSPPCGYFSAMSRPSAQNCPKDFTVYAEDRIKTVTWVDPTFDNLGVAGKVHQGNDNLKGKAYTWGKYEVIYVGSDGSGNSAYCHFSFYVQPFRCNSPPDPFGGFQFSNATDPLTGVVRHGRTIGCYNTNTPTVVNYKTDREHPKTFTCDPYGTWNNVKPFRKFRYPSCGAVKPKPQGKITLHLEYNLTTGACESVKVNLIQLLKQEVSKLDLIYQGDLCKMSDCSDIDVTITCSGFSAGRRKRQVVYASVLAVIKLGNIPTQTSLDGETLSVQDFFTYFALGAKVFDFSSTIANADILPQRFVIDSTLICPEYEVLLDGECVECGLGNVYRYNNETGVAICEDCPLGQYQDNFKQKACKECPAGTTTEMTGEYQASMCKAICQVGHYFNNDLDKCMPCKIGYYQDLMGQFYCKWCGPSFTTENEGSTSDSQCSSQCESGYQLSGPNNCTPCLIGQYRNATESRVCMNCPTGKITAAIASRSADACSITACTSGNYRRSSDNTCQPCPLNYYQNETWQDQCKPCGNGNFSMWRTTSTGSSKEQDCLFYCPSGYEVSLTQAQTCVPCARDQYKDNNVDIQGLCTPCPNNLRASSIAATAQTNCTIYKCPIGQSPNPTQTGCVLCALGSYQDVAESETCKMCPASQSTRTVGATAQSACENYCDSGYEKVGSACVPCAVGSYKENTAGLFSNCTACDPLYTTPSMASTSRTACSIRTCPAGTYRNVGDTGCTDCDLGYYQPQQFQTSCLKCPDDTSTMQTKSTLATDCKAYCPNGKEMVNSVCQNCSRGYFRSQSDGLFAMCQMCSPDKITPSTGATTISQCIIGNCSAGYRLKTDNTCEICPKGSYSESKWLTTCTPCGIHKTTEREGATNQSLCIVECEQGFEDASGACVPCQQGFYKDIKAAAQCKPCPVGYITSGSGAINLTMCNIPACSPGTFLNETASPAACQVCGYDTYQDTKWQKSCKSCSANLVTLQTGSTSLAQCVADCASGQEYSTTNRVCRFCSIGFYRDRNDRLQPSCQMCDIRYITAGEGAKSVAECNIANCTVPGQYRNTLNVCTPCPVGEYSSEKWRTSCERCPDGYSTRGIGKTTLADCIRSCPLGEYVTLANTCEMCAKGTYRTDPSTESCIPCPDNLTTPTVGSRTRDACSISPCIAGQRYSQNRTCEACPIATYQPMAGMFNCLNCPANRNLTLALGAKAVEECKTACQAGEMWMWGTGLCEKCPHGFYQPSAEQFTCMQCPAARGSTVSPSRPDGRGAISEAECKDPAALCATKPCSSNETCAVNMNTTIPSAFCQCNANYQRVGLYCLLMSDVRCQGYCKNNGVCEYTDAPRCTCTEAYEGAQCDVRKAAEKLADSAADIAIPVGIAAGGLLLLLILLAVFCLCWHLSKRRNQPRKPYTELNGERLDKASLHSYPAYGQTPLYAGSQRGTLMLASYPEAMYDNRAYRMEDIDHHSNLGSSAVYQA